MAASAVLWAGGSYLLPWRPDREQLSDAAFYGSWLLMFAAGAVAGGLQYGVGWWLRRRGAGKIGE
jgi:hypothetical protein